MKWAVIKVAHRCFRCLRKGHLSRCCERNPCSCGGGHHALLCKGQDRSTNSAVDVREKYFSGTALVHTETKANKPIGGIYIPPGRRRQNEKKSRRCFWCQKQGHVRKDCLERRKQQTYESTSKRGHISKVWPEGEEKQGKIGYQERDALKETLRSRAPQRKRKAWGGPSPRRSIDRQQQSYRPLYCLGNANDVTFGKEMRGNVDRQIMGPLAYARKGKILLHRGRNNDDEFRESTE